MKLTCGDPSGDAGAVHEDDLPGASLFLQEGRFQPVLVHGAGSVRDAAFIDVGIQALLPLISTGQSG
jgi:hypothetical protein